ncbi:MAG TPA: acyltransferase [Nitrospira sp.]|nr:acyltransferase [Nitrospira sp.]
MSAPGRAPAADTSHGRILELDGFRAAAVLMIFVHHLFFGWPLDPAAFSWMPRVVVEAIAHGWLGVDLFFILSGFLITGILLDSRQSAHYFRNFYMRRTLRIVPLYFTCILLMSFAYPGAGAYFVLSLLFLANFHYQFGVSAPHGPSIFWSLAIEEHFYLLWPLLVRLLTRTSLFALTVILVFGTPILRGICAYLGMDPELQIYLYSFFRFDGLALGAILALWVRSRYYSRDSAWTLAGVLLGFVFLVTVIGWPFGIMGTKTVASLAFRYTQAQFVFASAIALALAYRGSRITGILRSRFARITADLSYCIYLIHLALGDAYYSVLHSSGLNDEYFGPLGALAVRSLVIATLTFGLAALSKRFLEDPFLRLKRYF